MGSILGFPGLEWLILGGVGLLAKPTFFFLSFAKGEVEDAGRSAFGLDILKGDDEEF